MLTRKQRPPFSFYALTDTRMSAPLFIGAVFAYYAVLPVFVHNVFLSNEYFLELAGLSLLSCFMLSFGYRIRFFDGRFAERARRIKLNPQLFHAVVWSSFAAFLVFTFATADAVPIVSAFKGLGTTELDQQRGNFLKARVGIEAILPYLSTAYVSALLPYSLSHLFLRRSRARYLALMLFLAYCLSFLNKALFINLLIPLLYLTPRTSERSGSVRFLSIAAASLALLVFVTTLAIGDDAYEQIRAAQRRGTFFEASYAPTNTVETLVWRSAAVPLFTASDTLRVFDERLGGGLLWGTTSILFSTVFSTERVLLERMVFEDQWGWNDVANSNSVYITEAFVNFGWVGVAAFSLFIGQSLRWFLKSRDEGFKALWGVYCFGLFSGGLIGMLLSNGYLLMFGLAFFTKLPENDAAVYRAPGARNKVTVRRDGSSTAWLAPIR